MLQWIQNNIQILFPIVFFGLSGLGWLMKKLQEANQKKRADEARKRARLEALRTGRIDGQQQAPQRSGSPARPTAQAATPRQSLEDLARRRQEGQQQRADLEEQLRRRREAIEAQRLRQQQQRQPAPARAPASRPGQRPTQPQARQPVPPPPPPQRTAVKPTPTPRRTGERRPVSPLPTMQPIQQTGISDVIGARRAEEARPIEAPLPVARAGRRLVPLTARGIDLRQAVVMHEILDRPVGLREPVDPGW